MQSLGVVLVQVGQRRGLQIINIMNNDGSLNSNAGQFSGLDRGEARTAVWEALEVRQQLSSHCPVAKCSLATTGASGWQRTGHK